MKKLKYIVKKILRYFGVEINTYTPGASPTAQIISTLRNFEIDLILDVGANQGQFAADMRSGGYSGDIVSFEPLTQAHSILQQASLGDDKWDVYPRCALGDHNGEVEINIAGNSYSSSLLPMMDSHISAAPLSAYIGKESVSLLTLDSVAAEYVEKFKNPFLKIDTQGFEGAILNGATNVLSKMRGVLLELSLIPLYEGQYLWKELIARLESEGFVLWAIQSEYIEPHNGRTLQINGIFVRE